MTAPVVSFDVQRITVEGYSSGERRRFVAALNRELTAIGTALGEGQNRPSPGRIGHVDAGTTPRAHTPEAAAAQVGAGLRQALSAPGGASA